MAFASADPWRRWGRAILLAGVLAGVLALAADAAEAASGPSQEAALAESLFREAKQLAKDGDLAEACPKFAESQRLDAQLGTLLHLATCHEQQGKTATAWAEYSQAADWAARDGDRKREGIARRRAAALEPELSHLVVEVEDLRDGMTVALDGRELGMASLATPLPVDPGAHEIEASAPGAASWTETIDVPESKQLVTIRIPPLPDGDPEASAAGESEPADGSAQRIAGWTLGGVGVVGLVVMTIFGVKANGEAADADAFCEGRYCTDEGLEGHDDAHTSATVSTVAFIVGLASLGAGLTLVLTAPDDDGEDSSAWLAPAVTPDGVLLGGGVRW